MPPRKRKDEEAARVQDEWRSAVDEDMQDLIMRLKEAARADVTKRVVCPHCNHTVPVTVVDIRARTDAINSLIDRGYGKAIADGGGGSLTVIRQVILPDGFVLRPGDDVAWVDPVVVKSADGFGVVDHASLGDEPGSGG